MSINIVGKNCCGCRTCKTICKFNAISVITDKYCFEQMSVDKNKCVECRMCEKVCPILNVQSSSERHSCGAAYALDNNIKFWGSSGGLFGVFSRQIILDGGCVYGAAFDNNLKLKTTSAETLNDLVPLYKSKYLLCDTDDKFIEIKLRLDKGKKVLYCSSPCQVAALKLYLKKNYENLLTVDFVCHGVGSQVLFDKSIEYSEKKLSAKIRNVVFRHKNKNASSHYYLYSCEKNKGKKFYKQDLYLSFPYYNAYCKQLICREGCYTCKYATGERCSDITIGDFHTIEKYDQSINRFAGISMFVCNSLKGELFFNSVKRYLFVKSFDWEVLKANNRFHSDGSKPQNQREFMESIANNPFEITVKKYLQPIRDWKKLIYYKSPSFLRNIVKKIGR